MSDIQFILASSSTSRRTMLEAAGVVFTVVAPNVDEDLMKDMLTGGGADGATIAHALAEAKALAASERHRHAVVLGADQVLVCQGRIFNKALDEGQARATLCALRGEEHELISAAVIARDGTAIWRRTDIARLTMREFSDAFLDQYLTAEMPDILGSVGCYRIEGRGAQLFSNVKGDHFCIRGLPLIAVLEALARFRRLAAMSAAKLAGVIGWPVHQSLSPLMHSYWLKEHGIAGAYVALPVAPEDFGRAVAAMPAMGFAGANVTVPHKEAAFALSATLDEDSRATGAVNTLVFEGGLIHGRNTDVRGFAASLIESLGEDAARRGPVVVLGAGGAARAVLLALLRAGATEIRLVNRTRNRAEALAAGAGKAAKVKLVEWGDWRGAFGEARLLVNTTSLGMIGKPPLELSLDGLPGDAAVADIVYNPLETPLLKAARARGHRTMDGLGMLMHQAAPAFAAWFGVTPKVTAGLREELVKALPRD